MLEMLRNSGEVAWFVIMAGVAFLPFIVLLQLDMLGRRVFWAMLVVYASFCVYPISHQGGAVFWWQRWLALGVVALLSTNAVLILGRNRADPLRSAHRAWGLRTYFVLFLVWAAMASVMGTAPSVSLPKLVGLLVYIAVFSFFFPAIVGDTTKMLKQAFSAVLIISLLCIIASYIMLVISPRKAYRLPYFFGIFTSLALPGISFLAAPIAFYYSRISSKPVYKALFVLCFVTSVVSGSRAVALASVTGLIVVLTRQTVSYTHLTLPTN